MSHEEDGNEVGRIAHIDRGEGPAVVFSHGTMMSAEMFEPQIEALSDRYRVVAFDHRARGPAWEGPYDLYDLAEDCRRLLDELGIERCVLAGMSMGGFMALRFALRYPGRLGGLILIGSSGRSYSPDDQAKWEAHFRNMVGRASVTVDFVRDEAEICFSATTLRENPDLVDTWMNRWSGLMGDAVYHEACSWLFQDDIWARLGDLGLPVLAVHGEEDAAIPIDDARETIAAVPNGSLIAVPRAGHTVNLESPEIVNDAISRFLGEVYSD